MTLLELGLLPGQVWLSFFLPTYCPLSMSYSQEKVPRKQSTYLAILLTPLLALFLACRPMMNGICKCVYVLQVCTHA